MIETKRIDGKARADRLVAGIAAVTAQLKAASGVVPGLCAVLVGDDPASQMYVRAKGKIAAAAGNQAVRARLAVDPFCFDHDGDAVNPDGPL